MKTHTQQRTTAGPLETLFGQMLDADLHARWAACFQRRRQGDESITAFLERTKAVGPMALSVLKLVAKEFIYLEAARPLLAREQLAPQLAAFLSAEAAESPLPPPPAAPDSTETSPSRRLETVWDDLGKDLDAPSAPEAAPPTPSSIHSYRRSWVEADYQAGPDSQRFDAAASRPDHARGASPDHARGASPDLARGGSGGEAPSAGSTCFPLSDSAHPTKRNLKPEEGGPRSERSDRPVIDGADDCGGGFLPPGARMGKYTIGALLGQGAFGAVYASTHPQLRLPVAIKVMRSTISHGDDHERFRSEARLVAQLNHPAVVRVWDFDEDERGRPYLVMEYVDGATFADLVREKVQVPPEGALRIVRQVALGLQEAARLGIVHKDVKPANILISRSGAVKITDFGVAVLRDDELGAMLSIRAEANAVCGTVYYMPPEQAQGDEVDSRADMYALGVTLYQAVAGRLPFVGKTTAHILLKQLCESPIPPGDLVPGLPYAVSEVILKMMARLPADRYATYAELLLGLDAAEASLKCDAHPQPDLKSPSAARPATPERGATTWSAESQAASPPPSSDSETSGSIWKWLKRGAGWFKSK